MAVDISIIASAIRTELWQGFMDSLRNNAVDYEVIFVGSRRPQDDIPRLKFIYSEVKPAQCYQIAANHATGKMLHLTCDDAIYQDHFLDCAYQQFSKDKCLCANTIENGRECKWDSFTLGQFVMSPFAFFSRELFESIGGFDNRYVTGQYENDLCMRFHALGIKFVSINGKHIIVNHITDSEFSRHHDIGRVQLRRSWADHEYSPSLEREEFKLIRNDEHSPYVAENILTKSQGFTHHKWI